MRRIVEGHRVHEQIKQMAHNEQTGENPTKGVARESDFEKLQEFDEKVKSARRN